MANTYVEEVLSKGENQDFVNKIYSILDTDEEAARIMECSDSPESLYKVISRYIKVKFEDFKQALNNTIEYFTEPKTELDDSVLDCVIGGGFCDWFKKNWKAVAAITAGVVLAATGVGAIAGAAMIAAGSAAAATGIVVASGITTAATCMGVGGTAAVAGGVTLAMLQGVEKLK